jgi:nucleotide-binding universal stress UspA family protein
MKTILLPTDFSINAYCALFYVSQLLKETPCTFILVNSFENQITNLTSRIDIGKTEALVDELYTTCETKCDEIIDQIVLETKNKKHRYKNIVTSLTLSRAINKIIVKENIDFVIMGSKGSTAASDILMGSNTLSMIQKIKKAPLLIIPQEMDFSPLKRIGFASGFKRTYSKSELDPILFLTSLSKATIKVLHKHKKEALSEEQRKNFHQLFKLLKAGHPENHWLLDDSFNYNAIASYLNKEKIDVLAMINYKHNAIVQLFREATIKNLAKRIHIPFLILPKID